MDGTSVCAVCDYCGNRLLIGRGEPPVKNPEPAELNEPAICPALADKIGKLLKPVSDLEMYTARLSDISQKMKTISEKTREKKERLSTLIKSVYGLVICGILMVLMDTGSGTMMGKCFLCVCALALSYGFTRLTVSRSKEEMERLKKERRHIKNAMDRVVHESGLAQIPENYRTRDAVRFIHNALENDRVSTVKQAINLYEDHLLEQKLESMLREKNLITRQTEKTDSNADNSLMKGALIAVGILLLRKSKRRSKRR